MNPLPLIALWLETFPYHDCSDMRRKDLIDWITKPTLNGKTLTIKEVYHVEDVDLAVDCLIAAGIGEEADQYGTVYGRFTYA